VNLDRQLNRWTIWAQSMATRHERFAMRRGLLAMTLLEPLRMSLAITQRSESFAQSVFPRIQVSIASILQQIDAAQYHAFIQQVRVHNLSSQSRSLTRSDQSNNAVTLRHNTTAIHSLQQQFNSMIRAHQELQKFSLSPVARFFARAQTSEHGVVRLEKLLVDHDRKTIVERVVREHSRVEQRSSSDIVMRQQKPSADATESRTSLTLEQQLAATKTQRHVWPAKPAEINVDQLTEQVIRKIDHRIMAYRERLGRAF